MQINITDNYIVIYVPIGQFRSNSLKWSYRLNSMLSYMHQLNISIYIRERKSIFTTTMLSFMLLLKNGLLWFTIKLYMTFKVIFYVLINGSSIIDTTLYFQQLC